MDGGISAVNCYAKTKSYRRVGKGAEGAVPTPLNRRRKHVGTLRFAHPTVPSYCRAKPYYRRLRVKGGTFFFTVVLADRTSDLLVRHVDRLRCVYASVTNKLPFETVAICILPDHIHAIWTLPENDSNYAARWSLIKSGFSRGLPPTLVRSPSKIKKREKGLWQRRYWEHAVRDDEDLTRHIDYIHFNPVKHGLVPRVQDWPDSSFHQYVARGDLPLDWGGDMCEMPATFGE